MPIDQNLFAIVAKIEELEERIKKLEPAPAEPAPEVPPAEQPA